MNEMLVKRSSVESDTIRVIGISIPETLTKNGQYAVMCLCYGTARHEEASPARMSALAKLVQMCLNPHWKKPHNVFQSTLNVM